ncbi:hypothetical protein [Actinoplanes sp. G11-F43]|uniref:hypothetical protein n=1 Tax=Actinoplanes sp. G11-F43 TaxID=3424130 RepID=UPI003D3314DB
MRDRRQARIGTVSGLALLGGATALVAVAGGHHSIFATLLLGLLSIVMAHALVVEIQRQARRMSQIVWYRTDTINTVLLACWAMISAAATNVPALSWHVRALTAVLAVGYAAACAYFVVERRRAVADPFRPSPIPLSATVETSPRSATIETSPLSATVEASPRSTTVETSPLSATVETSPRSTTVEASPAGPSAEADRDTVPGSARSV